MVSLAEARHHGLLRTKSISQQWAIPQRFLEQILNELRSAGFVESRRGAAGGYRLARPPEKINLAELFQSLEGTLSKQTTKDAASGVTGLETDEVSFVLGEVQQEVRTAARAVLERITLADLCERVRALRSKAQPGGADFVI